MSAGCVDEMQYKLQNYPGGSSGRYGYDCDCPALIHTNGLPLIQVKVSSVAVWQLVPPRKTSHCDDPHSERNQPKPGAPVEPIHRYSFQDAQQSKQMNSLLTDRGRLQPVSATNTANFFNGVRNPSVSRGRPLRLRWMRRRSAAECFDRSVPLDMY